MKERPEIIFPCDYPIKVIGIAEDSLRASVADIVECHCPDFDADTIEVVASRNRNYVSLRLLITAQGKDHIQRLFTDLKSCANVQMVL